MTAILYINGKLVKHFMWAPFECDVTDYLKDGVNEFMWELFASNRNLLGPHHHIDGELYAVWPASFTDTPTVFLADDRNVWSDLYHFCKIWNVGGTGMKKGKKVSKLAFHEALRGYLFIAPALILLLGLLFLPMVKGFGYSLTDFNILKNWDYNFIGLENFQKILKNRDFPVILKNEVFFALTVTVITVIVSILIALLLNSVKRCKNIVRALVFMPWVLPEVVVGSLWRWLLNGEKGLINSVLVDYWHVLPEHIQFFSSSLSLISVCMVYIWRTYPYVTIMLSAGLQGIDRGLYEAASIDGCGKIKQFRYVTLPGLKYVLSICSLMAMIWTMNGFGIINILTAGGPGVSSTTLPMVIYKTAFQKFRFGLASGYSVIQFFIIMVFALIYLKMTKATKEEEA